jgi:adenine-specific DNA-methyltransferase
MKLAIETSYKSANAEIWQSDAIEFLEKVQPNSISLIISSPPYFMGKEYDRSHSADDFVAQHERLFPLMVRAIKPGGSLCWQVGHHVRGGRVIPLDALVYGVAAENKELILRNRIVWMFNHGVHCSKRFSGRHETILWFTKGDEYTFDLDAVRVPQKYPGKRHYKGPRKGEWSGNPLGKNPGDIWDIPNVKARHVEKTDHPCQFPTALVRRFVRALTKPGDLVADPFLGSGTTCVVALLEERNFLGCEIETKYLRISKTRLESIGNGQLRMRPDTPVRLPRVGEAVSTAPPHFAVNLG